MGVPEHVRDDPGSNHDQADGAPAKRARRQAAPSSAPVDASGQPSPHVQSSTRQPAKLKAAARAAAEAEADGSTAMPAWQPSPAVAADPVALASASLLAQASAATLSAAYSAAVPYPHCVLRDVFDTVALRAVRQEIIHNVQATYKETDLFKVFQTGDLGNLDGLDAEAASRLPALTALKAALYSPAFRAFVQTVTGCGVLSEQTDCSCNIYAQGGHLLCHDDVIGSRCVSYIVYLTDPDQAWSERDGGALELYPLEEGQEHSPGCCPTTLLVPAWNSMAMFTVLPGRSFHAVQEVAAAGLPRMSISGWYHAAAPPADAERASLQQLQLRPGQDAVRTYTPFAADAEPSSSADPGSGGDEDSELSDADLALLVRYVNPVYLAQDAWAKIAKRFQADGSVQLQAFLKKSLATRISAAALREDLADGLGAAAATATAANGAPPSVGGAAAIPSAAAAAAAAAAPAAAARSAHRPPAASASDATAAVEVAEEDREVEEEEEEEEGPAASTLVVPPSDYAAGVRDGWRLAGPPHKQRYVRYDNNDSSSGPASTSGRSAQCGALLTQVRHELLESAPFRRLLHRLTTLQMVGHAGEVRRFRPGLDYTVAHYGILTQDPRLDAVLCFVADAEPEAATAWEMGELGGFEAYLLAEEEAEGGAAAADVYRKDAEESGVLNVSAASNSLNLVLRDEGLMRFVKFVSGRAPGSRWDVAMEYQPEDDSDSEEGGEEEAVEAADGS